MIQPINCPKCGFRIGDKRNYSKEIENFMKEYSRDFSKVIRSLHKQLISTLPSENLISLYFFLLRLNHEKISEQVIEHAINQFLQAEYHLQGKGYRYLQAIVINIHTNDERVREYEQNRIGSPPPVAD